MYHTSLSTMIPPEKKKGEILKVNNNIYYVLKEGKDQFLEAKNNKNWSKLTKIQQPLELQWLLSWASSSTGHKWNTSNLITSSHFFFDLPYLSYKPELNPLANPHKYMYASLQSKTIRVLLLTCAIFSLLSFLTSPTLIHSLSYPIKYIHISN